MLPGRLNENRPQKIRQPIAGSYGQPGLSRCIDAPLGRSQGLPVPVRPPSISSVALPFGTMRAEVPGRNRLFTTLRALRQKKFAYRQNAVENAPRPIYWKVLNLRESTFHCFSGWNGFSFWKVLSNCFLDSSGSFRTMLSESRWTVSVWITSRQCLNSQNWTMLKIRLNG
jgi:hypothetical protein